MAGKMSMRARVIAMTVCLAILAGAVAAVVVHNNRQKAEEEANASSESVVYSTLFQNDRADIKQVTLTNADGTLVLLPTDETGSDGTMEWVLEGHEDWSLTHTYQNIITMAALFQSYKKIEDNVTGEDRLSDFGLKEPFATLTVEKKDGSVDTAYIGDLSSDGEYCFVRVEGDDTVYAADSNYHSYTSMTLNDIRLATIEELNTDDTLTELFAQKKGGRAVKIHKDDNASTKVQSGEAVYITTDLKFDEPYHNDHLEVSNTLEDDYFANLTTPTVVETIDADCQDLDKYGLGDEPEYRETITTRSGSSEDSYEYHTTDYLFGYTYGDNDEYIYMREGDSNMVLGVQADCLSVRQFDPFFYVNKLMFLNPITNVDSGSVTYNGETHDFTIKREEVDEESSVAAQDRLTSYRMDGQLVDEDSFTSFYRTLIEIAPDYEILDETPDYDENDKLTFTFNRNDGSTVTLTYYRLSEFYYVTKIDDSTWFTTSYTYIQSVEEALQKVVDAEGTVGN